MYLTEENPMNLLQKDGQIKFAQRFNRLWVIGKKKDVGWIRFYPNPGFSLRIGKRELYWSRFYGFRFKKLRVVK